MKQGVRRFADFPDTTLPSLKPGEKRRRFWRELREITGYHLWLRFGNLKLWINRRPWLRNLLLPLVRWTRRLRYGVSAVGDDKR